jgi:hypothetical protein
MYYHQSQQILLALSVNATCFGPVDYHQALKYTILKTRVKTHVDILKFARSCIFFYLCY